MFKRCEASNEYIHLLAVGDVMLGDHPVCFGHGIRSTIEKYGFQYLFAHTENILADSDVLFGNLETVLHPEDNTSTLYNMEMKGKSEYAQELAKIGFNVMSMANNHAMQYGADAYNHTVKLLRDSGIEPVGVNDNGKSNIYLYTKDGINLAFVGYSFRPEKYADAGISYAQGDELTILEQIHSLNKDDTRVIVSVHWGEEYLHYPSVAQVHLAKRMIDAGASIILGHHPHVLQGVEEYSNGIIVYSLGNYIFDSWDRSTRESIIFDCKIDKSGALNYSIIPTFINRNYQPVILIGKEKQKLMNKIKNYSNGIIALNAISDTPDLVMIYQNKAEKAYFKYRIGAYLYFLRNIYKYKISVISHSLTRFIKRRINPDHP